MFRFDEITLDEAIAEIGNSINVDTSDWYGKYLALGEILRGMDSKEADQVLRDQFTVMEDEIKNTYESIEVKEVA